MMIDLIPVGVAITRARLCKLTGMTDRQVRKEIHYLRRDYCILNMQDGTGYYRPNEEDRGQVEAYLKQEASRAKSIFWAQKGARQWLRERTGNDLPC